MSPILYQLLERIDKVQSVIEEILHAFLEPQFFVVDLSVHGNQSRFKIELKLDGDQGISIDQCAAISRRLISEIESRDLIEGHFNLEVSSPGLDYPLVQKRQYHKNIGRKFKILTLDNKTISGELLEVGEEDILLLEEKKIKKKVEIGETRISFSNIKQAKVLVSFN
jgi:ribosome maturation factor RimP